MSDSIKRKILSDELAQLIFEGEAGGERMEELAAELGVRLQGTDMLEPLLPEPKVGDGDTVGVWVKEVRKGETFYVRDVRQKEDWTYWSQTATIPPKQGRKRIVLLGESVARGYLYDPYYCPAQVLQDILNGTSFLEGEVIDLARTNLDLTNLELLTQECLALDPDAIVVFAGNNWFYSIKRSLTREDLLKMRQVLKEEGLKALREFLLVRFRGAIRAYMEQLAEIIRSKDIPVYFIIPEFNLLDWKSSQNEKILTALSNEDLKEWVGLRDAARAAIAAGESDAAYAMAQRMIGIDCSHPDGYEIAAEVCLGWGMHERARTYLEATRDTSLFTRAYSKPRAYAVIRETLLREAAGYGLQLIDLPAIFGAHNGGKLPGRDLFLDYCHLSEKGIQLAMAATARALIGSFSGVIVDETALCADQYKAAPDVHAAAYICAAVHNAHYGQTHDVLEYLCEMAAKWSPVAIEIMSNFVDFASRKTTTTLCKSHEKLVEKEFITQYGGGVGFLHKRGQKIMDLALVDAMIRAIGITGKDVREEVRQLRMQEHSVNEGTVNLISSYYHSTAYDVYSGNMPGYYQSRDVRSRFFLVAAPDAMVNFKLTFRTPFRESADDKVRIYINDKYLMEWASSEKWQTHHFIIPPEDLSEGLNVIGIQWSTGFSFRENDRLVDLTEDYILDKLYHVYGEISAFSATMD